MIQNASIADYAESMGRMATNAYTTLTEQSLFVPNMSFGSGFQSPGFTCRISTGGANFSASFGTGGNPF